jgi:hypothetical protein
MNGDVEVRKQRDGSLEPTLAEEAPGARNIGNDFNRYGRPGHSPGFIHHVGNE